MATLKVTNIKNESFAGDQLYLKSDGRLGIGTTAPSQLLHVKATSANSLLFVERDSGALAFLEAQAAKVTLGSSNNHPVHIVQNSGDALMIDSSKKVGIGTTSPSEKLHVEGNIRIGGSSTANTAGDDLVIEGSSDRGLSIISGTSSSANVYFGDSDDTDIGRIAYQQTDNKLQFYVNAGKCGLQILNTGATELLHNGSLSAVTAANDFDIYRRVRVHADRSSGMGGHLLAIGQWDGSNHRIEGDANRPIFITAYNAGGIKMGVSGSNKVTVTSDGLTFNGDTAAANALDDYEEGSFTPFIQGTGSNNSKTYTTQYGRYTKIGNVVTVVCQIAVNNAYGVDSGAMLVNGFPFNHRGSSSGAYGIIAMNKGSGPSGSSTSFEPVSGANYFYILESTAGAALANMVPTDLPQDDTFQIRASMTYPVS